MRPTAIHIIYTDGREEYHRTLAALFRAHSAAEIGISQTAAYRAALPVTTPTCTIQATAVRTPQPVIDLTRNRSLRQYKHPDGNQAKRTDKHAPSITPERRVK